MYSNIPLNDWSSNTADLMLNNFFTFILNGFLGLVIRLLHFFQNILLLFFLISTNYSFQFQAYAYDLGTPDSLDTNRLADIFIQVTRNNFPPQFLNIPYAVQIQETHPALASVFQTTAVDQDTVVIV